MKPRQEDIMTFLNEGEWDRGIRIVFGCFFLAAGWTFAPVRRAMPTNIPDGSTSWLF